MTLSHPTVTAHDFRHAFRAHPAGVAIVTADAGDGPVAMTVSSVASVAIDPPTLMFSASGISSSTPTIRKADTVVVHLLSADDVDLAKLCAQKGSQRFGDSVRWGRLPTGEPYYPDTTWLRGRIVESVDVAGSTIIIVEAIEAKPQLEDDTAPEPTPLVYHNRSWHILNGRSAMPEPMPPFCIVYGRDD
ncbi:flavin reductase family protein [Tessaracoccus sp. MC1756]|uniref:flavin reductase family protein n=1 Tax=Tessaracoccus sp. MC1756 TaxID=2760311 RepID=UPI001C728BBE|nr:flavin reductase family protein [Tessaracoccus sp. MC1756]